MRAVVGLIIVTLAACSSAPPPRPDPRDQHEVPAGTDGPPDDPTIVEAIVEPKPRAESRSKHGNPPAYRVRGKVYHPLADGTGYKERGNASWYGKAFHGRLTSNREAYDMHALSAAHRTLPLPSYVRVTHLENGRSVIVRVNDRGPFHDQRIIDLSWAAAAKLDMVKQGVAPVEVEVVASPPADDRPQSVSYIVQAGAFSGKQRADEIAESLKSSGVDEVYVESADTAAGDLHRVRVGPWHSLTDADQSIDQLKRLGFDSPRLIVE